MVYCNTTVCGYAWQIRSLVFFTSLTQPRNDASEEHFLTLFYTASQTLMQGHGAQIFKSGNIVKNAFNRKLVKQISPQLQEQRRFIDIIIFIKDDVYI